VWNNPSTDYDIDGNRCAHVTKPNAKTSGGVDALPLGCGATPVQADNNVTHIISPTVVAPQAPRKDAPKAKDPTGQNNATDRHVDWDLIGNIFGVISGITGLFFWVPGAGPVLAAVSAAAGLVSTAISCLAAFAKPTAPNVADCVIGALLTAAPFIPQIIKAWIREVALNIVREVIQAVGSVGDGLAIGESGGKIIGQIRK
jgi:hypothetical protein